MWRKVKWVLGTMLVAVVSGSTKPAATRVMSHEFIVVYVGVEGVDHAMKGLADTVRLAAARRLVGPGQQLVLRGVSLDPDVATGMRDLALVGSFNEVSLGGNWTNSSVVHYLGGDFGRAYERASVPQVIVLERDVDNQITALYVGPEHEIARYIGTKDIWDWAKGGAPFSK
ncbi:MAG TPA: hypothetical protein VGQ44_15745 [Gemmatimonadaceae bacterium]|nr:hypothetical protein [Gemmatimonadaceae bacterium]